MTLSPITPRSTATGSASSLRPAPLAPRPRATRGSWLLTVAALVLVLLGQILLASPTSADETTASAASSSVSSSATTFDAEQDSVAPPTALDIRGAAVAPMPCHVSGVSEELRCASLRVAENPDDPTGRQLGLRIVIAPARAVLLSGAADPVVPPRWGEVAAARFAHGRHLVVPGTGHGTVGTGCMPRLVAAFLDDPSMADSPDVGADFDVRCLDGVRRPPFMVGAHGPTP